MIRNILRALGFGALAVALSAAPALAKPDSIFNGIVRHVSTTNIKVYNPATQQTLSFAIAPSFKNVFKSDGKSTQMKTIAAGQYVKVYYTRRLLGMASTDKIYLLDQQNQRIGKN